MDDILRRYERIKNESDLDPLKEVLRLYDLLSLGAISKPLEKDLEDYSLTLDDYIKKRKEGLPPEYIIGNAVFRGRSFKCTNATLIPTPETGMIVDIVRDLSDVKDPQDIQIIDIGTGCGNLAISLALEIKNSIVHATDISDAAIEITKENISRYDLGGRVRTYIGDMFSPFNNNRKLPFADIIVSNPPYLPTRSIDNLPPEIRDNEPREAFDAGPFGTNIFMGLFDQAPKYLKGEGYLITEIGEGQDRLVKRIARKSKGDYEIDEMEYDGKVRFLILRLNK